MESRPDIITQNQPNKKPNNSKKITSKPTIHISKGQGFNNIKNSLVSVNMLFFLF